MITESTSAVRMIPVESRRERSGVDRTIPDVASSQVVQAPSPLILNVMTFNIRYDEESDGRHAWSNRRHLALEMLQSHDPDLLGLQEPTASQWETIAAGLPTHSPFGGADDECGPLEPHGGFFRTARFESIDSGVFWLSDTPSIAYSLSWPNDWGSRACGWVKLHDRFAERDILFACTHLDTNAGAWLPSAKVLHAELDNLAGDLPIILVGDFNCVAGSEAYRYLHDEAGYRDVWREAGNPDDGVITFNGFKPLRRLPAGASRRSDGSDPAPIDVDTGADYPRDARAHGNYRIDWILLRGPLLARSAIIDYSCDKGLLPSDHYPVVACVDYVAP
jgi:endonuclease/exonuclease/phosphatase family metal-dependent hydrolase